MSILKDLFGDTSPITEPIEQKEGDWVMMRSFSGTRFKVHGKEFRLINDDTVEAVVDDPTGVVRA